jgi:hypothetical protein
MGRFDILTQLNTNPRPLTPKGGMSSPASQPESSNLSHLHANLQTRLQVKKLTSKDANPQTSKPASTQESKPANLQTGLHTNPQTGKPFLIEKYSTYLTPECKRGLRRIAFESDRKDYEVLIEAVTQYLERQA